MKRALCSDRITCLWLVATCVATTTCKASLSLTSASAHRSIDTAAETANGVPPRIYLTKIKNLLTGSVPTQAEVDAVIADPSAMNGLVRGWLTTPQGQAATLAFFRNSFQQANIPGATDYTTVLGPNMEGNLNTADAQMITGNGNSITGEFTQSYEKTAWELAVNRAQPFNGLWTSRQFYATTAMLSMMLYTESTDLIGTAETYDEAYPDEVSNMFITSNPNQPAGPDGNGNWYFQVVSGAAANTTINGVTVASVSGGPVIGPVNCGLASASGGGTASARIASHPGGPHPNAATSFTDFSDSIFEAMIGYPVPVEQPSQSCFVTPQPACTGSVFCAPATAPWDLSYVGSAAGQTFPYASTIGGPVPTPAFRVKSGQFTAADHSDWRLVTSRDLQPGEKPTRFWDLDNLRSVSESNVIPMRIQRVGPFTSPAFLANWATNANNQARSTANQMLIISVGGSFDGTNTSVLSSQQNTAADTTQTTLSNGETASDAAHASSPACQSCHVALDPLRKFYSKNLTYGWGQQTDPNFTAATPTFNFAGVTKTGSSFADLGAILANHPALATAWVQKACYWVNSSPCSDSDPEFVAIAQSFASGYNFVDMIAALLSSPMVTNASDSFTQEDQGEVISISRLDHLCKTLAVRLGNPNLCSYSGVTNIILNIPTDGYTRGATEPFQPSDPGLFFRAAVENVCVQIAPLIVDSVASSTNPVGPYTSGDPGSATSDMVHNLMGVLPSDPRESQALQILNSHYTRAIATGSSPTTALRSTFVLACTSPAVVSIGL